MLKAETDLLKELESAVQMFYTKDDEASPKRDLFHNAMLFSNFNKEKFGLEESPVKARSVTPSPERSSSMDHIFGSVSSFQSKSYF